MFIKILAQKYYNNAQKILREVSQDPRRYPYEAVKLASVLYDLGVEGIERELRKHLICSGCVSCKHSDVFDVKENPILAVTLTARKCKFGYNQFTCTKYEKM